jgi:hypothetical protein
MAKTYAANPHAESQKPIAITIEADFDITRHNC